MTLLLLFATLTWLMSVGVFVSWLRTQRHPNRFLLCAALGVLAIVLTLVDLM